MVPTWLHAFSLWYLVSLVYTIKWAWDGGVIVGVLISLGLLSDIWMHISVYLYWDLVDREIPLSTYIFPPLFVAGLSCLYFQFVYYTNASVIRKILLAVSFVVVTVIFTPAKDTPKDVYWHANHALLHFITGFVPYVCTHYLQEQRTLSAKAI